MEGAQALYIERQLREVARVRYEELKNQTRHELVQTLDTMMDGSDVVMMSCSSQSCRRRKFKLAPLIGNGPYTFENLFRRFSSTFSSLGSVLSCYIGRNF